METPMLAAREAKASRLHLLLLELVPSAWRSSIVAQWHADKPATMQPSNKCAHRASCHVGL